MGVLVLSGILAMVVFGCVCIVWAQRGGPRWVRGVAAVTLVAGEVVRRAAKSRSSSNSSGGGDGD